MGPGQERDPQTYAVIGAAMEVHSQLGHGFLEAVYQEALAVELSSRAIPSRREVAIPVRYKETVLSCGYKADFLCYGELVVELKALDKLSNNEMSQVVNYLKATGLTRALLINFGSPHLEYKRIVLSRQNCRHAD